MLPLLKGAVYVQLAAHYKLPEVFQTRIQALARERAPEKIVTYLQDESISRNRTREEIRAIKQVLEAIKNANKDVRAAEDAGTLIANYESMTGNQFPKPAWMSMEMSKVDLNRNDE